MVNGLLISQDGTVQVLGMITDYETLINAVSQLPEQLRRFQFEQLAVMYSKEQLEQILELQSNKPNTSKTERLVLEP